MNYYLGIDNGGTATKASVFDSKGKELATVGTDTAMIVPKPGYVERNMEEMWEANAGVIRSVIEKAGISSEEIACVSVCGHGKGLYLWGKDNRPVRNGIISTDNRAWKYPIQWEEEGIAKEVFRISYQKVLSSQPVSLLAWLRDYEPEVLERTQWIFECKDYIRFRLTGQAFGEITDYSGANLVNLNTAKYDEELLKLFGLSDCMNKLPPLRRSTDICGYVTEEASSKTGLKKGTPVAGGAFDIDACAIAVDVVNEDNICMIAGTWSINEYISKKPVTDGSVMMNSFFCLPGYYLIEECSPTSAGNNEWFIKKLLPELREQSEREGKSIYDTMNSWVGDLPEEEFCPIFLPFLMASNVHPNAMGCFVGISNYHTRQHLARSIYEGIAFSHRYHYERLLATRESKPKSIRLAGGAARSRVWTQIFANVMNAPVEAVTVNETGTLGCAVIGAVAAGEYKDIKQAAKNMCNVARPVMPNPDKVSVYEKKYKLYKRTIEALDILWDDVEQYLDTVRENR